FSWTPSPPISTLFPYTTLFRSGEGRVLGARGEIRGRRRHLDFVVDVADVGHPLAHLLFRQRARLLGIRLAAQQHATVEAGDRDGDRKSTRLNSSHVKISYAVFC